MTETNNQQNSQQSREPNQLDCQRVEQILQSAKELQSIKSQTELSSALVDKLFDFTKWVIKYSAETNEGKGQQNPVLPHSVQPQQKLVKSQPQPQSIRQSTEQEKQKPATPADEQTKAPKVGQSQSNQVPVQPRIPQPHAPQDVRQQTSQLRSNDNQDKKTTKKIEQHGQLVQNTVEMEDKPVILQKKVHRTIFVQFPNGLLKRIDQSHLFTGSGSKDIQTGTIMWNNWNKQEAELPAYNPPLVHGYHSHPAIVEAIKITPKSDDKIIEISYHLDSVIANNSDNNSDHVPSKPQKTVAETRQSYEKNTKKQDERERKHLSFFHLIWLAFVALLGFSTHH